MTGVVVVWSGERPRYEAIPIDGTLIIGRERLDPDDIEISRAHVQLTNRGMHLDVTDLGGRNGTLVNGQPVRRQTIAVTSPAIIRIGRTICIAVADIAPYQDLTLTRRGTIAIGGTLAESCRRVDTVALVEEHLALLGTLAVGGALAQGYADRIGGDRLEAHLDPMTTLTLERSIDGIDTACSPRTLIVVLHRPITEADRVELEQWLETDIRLVTVARCSDSYKYLSKELRARLMPHVVEIPALRYDELPATVVDVVAQRAPGMRIHASLIEAVLLQLGNGEERVMRWLPEAVDELVDRELPLIRGSDFEDYLAREAARRNCVVGV